VGRKHREIVHHTLPQNLPVIGRGGAMEGSMGCLRKKVGRAGCFPSPLHETLKTCDSNKLTRQGEAAVGSLSGPPPPRERGEPIRETPHEFKGLVGMAWTRSGVERSSNVHSSRIVSRCRPPLSFRQRPGEGAD